MMLRPAGLKLDDLFAERVRKKKGEPFKVRLFWLWLYQEGKVLAWGMVR